jgi:AcrR family transcriptional regulator
VRAQVARRLEVQKPRLPPAVVPSGTKGRILKVALELFATRGFHGASIRDIAGELSLQPGALYVHFPSKEHLLAELVRLGHEAHYRGLEAALAGSGAEPVAQLRAVVGAHARFHADYAMLALVIDDEMHVLSSQLGAAALTIREKSVALLSRVIERGVKKGKLKVPHLFVATAAIGAIGMRVAHWFKPGFELTAEQVGDIQGELAVRMLGGK